MASPEQARLTSYTVRLPDLGATASIDLRDLQVLAVYGRSGECCWHRGRVDLNGGRSVELPVRDMGHGTAAANAWRKVLAVASRDGWGPVGTNGMADLRQAQLTRVFGRATVRDCAAVSVRGTEGAVAVDDDAPVPPRNAEDMVILRNAVEGLLDDFDRARGIDAMHQPERTHDTLKALSKALRNAVRDPIALEFLDDGQIAIDREAVARARKRDPAARLRPRAEVREMFGIPQPLQRPLPPGQGTGMLTVQGREFAERLDKCTARAVALHSRTVRRGRKPQAALRVLVCGLVWAFEEHSGLEATAGVGRGVRAASTGRTGRATRLHGGAFHRFLGAILNYGAALHKTPVPTVGARLLGDILAK